MILNSFCVIVYDYGVVVYNSVPQTLNEAQKTFSRCTKKYGDRKYLNLPIDKIPVNVKASVLGGYSDDWIEERIRMWKGDTEMVFRMAQNIAWSVTNMSIKIEVIHSSLT